MARGQKVRVEELQVGTAYLLSRGFGNNLSVTYTGTTMGTFLGIPLPWTKVHTFSENGGNPHKIESQQVEQVIYHLVDDK